MFPTFPLLLVIDTNSENNIVQQQTSFNALCQNLGHASSDEISTVLAEREVVESEAELSPDVIKRLQKRIAEKSVS
jgi:hypothetical protein